MKTKVEFELETGDRVSARISSKTSDPDDYTAIILTIGECLGNDGESALFTLAEFDEFMDDIGKMYDKARALDGAAQ